MSTATIKSMATTAAIKSKKQNMKLSEPKKGWWTPVPEPPGEGAGTLGRTSTGAVGGGSADTRAHSGYQSRQGGSRDAGVHRHRGHRGEGARAPTAETLATVGRGTVTETLATGGHL